MSYPIHMVPAGDTLPVFFDSFDGGTGASITMTGLAVTDVEIYKDGSVTQRASDAGVTLLDTDGIDFDGITGIHGFSIDTGDNTDAGFYAVGSWFHVVVSAVTIDAQTVNFIACAFRIMAAEGVAGVPEVDLTHVNAAAQTATLDTIKAETVLILADTNELQADDYPTSIAAVQAAVDLIPTTAMRGTDSAALASVATEARLAELDAGNLPADIAAVPTLAEIIAGLAPEVRYGTAQAGAATTITLDAGANAADDYYNGALILIVGGTGATDPPQVRAITDYVGATKVATVATWGTNPDATSVFLILGLN